MTEPAPDEKVCPFCAETIKKAAVKCRYCQSELPAEPAQVDPVAAELADPVAAPVAAEVPPPPAPTEDRGSRGSFFSGLPLMVVLLVLCLALAAVTAIAYHRSKNPDQGSGPITSTSARETGLTEAASLTEKVLSYNWKSLDQDIKTNEALLAPSFRSEYAKTMKGVHDQTLKAQVVLNAQVVASSAVSATPQKIVALLFVDQTTTAKGTQNRRLDQNRVLVTLTRDGGEWRVSKMDAF